MLEDVLLETGDAVAICVWGLGLGLTARSGHGLRGPFLVEHLMAEHTASHGLSWALTIMPSPVRKEPVAATEPAIISGFRIVDFQAPPRIGGVGYVGWAGIDNLVRFNPMVWYTGTVGYPVLWVFRDVAAAASAGVSVVMSVRYPLPEVVPELLKEFGPPKFAPAAPVQMEELVGAPKTRWSGAYVSTLWGVIWL